MTNEPGGAELREEGALAEDAGAPEPAREVSGVGGLDEEAGGLDEEAGGGFDDEADGLDVDAGEFDEDVAGGLDEEAGGFDEDAGEIDEVAGGFDEELGEVDDEEGVVYGELDEGTAFEPSPMRQVLFINVEVFLPSTNPVMVLRELDEPFRELRITIGSPEGVAIAYGWRGIDTPKPLTHELFTEVFELFGLSLEVVRITGVRGTAYSGEIVVNGPVGSRVLQCRVSDAIALAVRQTLPVPIMVSPEVLDEVGSTVY